MKKTIFEIDDKIFKTEWGSFLSIRDLSNHKRDMAISQGKGYEEQMRCYYQEMGKYLIDEHKELIETL